MGQTPVCKMSFNLPRRNELAATEYSIHHANDDLNNTHAVVLRILVFLFFIHVPSQRNLILKVLK